MTVRASAEHHTLGHLDVAGAVGRLADFARRLAPYALAAILLGATVLLAISCKGSTVAFRTGSSVAVLNVEVPKTQEERQVGLMYRKSLDSDSGMLFDYGKDVSVSFWMKNTSVPLSIAFISSGGEVIAIKDMEPFSLTPVGSPEKFRYAVEANKGWFTNHGVKTGTIASIDL